MNAILSQALQDHPIGASVAGLTQTLTALRVARALVEAGWTQGADARGKSGKSAYCHEEWVVCWCLTGAIQAAYASSPLSYAGYAAIIEELATMAAPDEETSEEVVEGSLELHEMRGMVESWNDAPARQQSEVLAYLDHALRNIDERYCEDDLADV